MTAEIFNYCERGQDPAFWAEPLNAWTNAAFIIAGLFALSVQLRLPTGRRTVDGYILIALLFAIGAGSFLFHTYATRWAVIADVVPIQAFIFVYLIFALVRLVGMAPGLSLIVVAAFGYGARRLGQLKCDADLAMRFDGGPGTCLNGSIGYMPAFGALIAVGLYLLVRGHPAARGLLTAAAVFAVSVTLRTLDPTLCDSTVIAGMRIGTHFLWHILNGLTLGILVVTGLRHWRHLTDESLGRA